MNPLILLPSARIALTRVSADGETQGIERRFDDLGAIYGHQLAALLRGEPVLMGHTKHMMEVGR